MKNLTKKIDEKKRKKKRKKRKKMKIPVNNSFIQSFNEFSFSEKPKIETKSTVSYLLSYSNIIILISFF
jgi:hypothetical protein